MKLSHVNEKGEARMIDVSAKPISSRSALACGLVYMKKQTLDAIKSGSHQKGDVLACARIAAIMAAKKTADIIPMCHPLMLSSIRVDLQIDEKKQAVAIRAACKLTGQTGVEMEALTAVSAAALTLYDMCKAVDRSMVISDIKLIEKRGGKSGDWVRKS